LDEQTQVLEQNPRVQEFLALLAQNGGGSRAEFMLMMAQLASIQRQLDEATRNLADMRSEIAALREDSRHPIRAALRRIADRLDNAIQEARAKLGEIKATIIEGVTQVVEAAKEKGVVALDKAAGFVGAKEKLAGLRDYLDGEVAEADKSIAKIEAVNAEYHKTGMHLRNIGRTLMGKEALQEPKPMGALAKGFRAPYKAVRAILAGASHNVTKAIGGLERLEKAARPSAIEAMRKQQMQLQARPPQLLLPARTRSPVESL
jgi:chromosome segregation ATPase